MANPILELLNRQNSRQNPLEMMLRQNPNYQNVMSYAQQNGGTYKDAFFNLCRQKGVNPNQIIDALQNKM